MITKYEFKSKKLHFQKFCAIHERREKHTFRVTKQIQSIIPIGINFQIEATKAEPEMDKVRFHLESDEEKEDEPDVSADAENVQLPLLQRSDSEKKKSESDKKQQQIEN